MFETVVQGLSLVKVGVWRQNEWQWWGGRAEGSCDPFKATRSLVQNYVAYPFEFFGQNQWRKFSNSPFFSDGDWFGRNWQGGVLHLRIWMPGCYSLPITRKKLRGKAFVMANCSLIVFSKVVFLVYSPYCSLVSCVQIHARKDCVTAFCLIATF